MYVFIIFLSNNISNNNLNVTSNNFLTIIDALKKIEKWIIKRLTVDDFYIARVSRFATRR